VGSRAGLDNVKRKFLTLPGLELRLFGRSARSQSLYRLRYPGSKNFELKLGYGDANSIETLVLQAFTAEDTATRTSALRLVDIKQGI
jgi:hypothetical protein